MSVFNAATSKSGCRHTEPLPPLWRSQVRCQHRQHLAVPTTDYGIQLFKTVLLQQDCPRAQRSRCSTPKILTRQRAAGRRDCPTGTHRLATRQTTIAVTRCTRSRFQQRSSRKSSSNIENEPRNVIHDRGPFHRREFIDRSHLHRYKSR